MKKMGYVALASLCIGIGLIIAGTALNGFDDLGTIYEGGNIDLPDFISHTETVDYIDKELDMAKNMDISIECSDLEIIEYDGSTIKVEAKKIGSKTQMKTDGNTFILKEKNSIGFHMFNSYKGGQIKIYIPRNYQFQNINIDIDAGEMTVPTLRAKHIEIDTDAGSFYAKQLETTYLKADVDAGSIEIDRLDSQEIELDCDAGDIEMMVVGSEQDYSYEVECDVGSITVGSYQSDGGIDDEYFKTGGTRKIKADCDVGNIDIRMED